MKKVQKEFLGICLTYREGMEKLPVFVSSQVGDFNFTSPSMLGGKFEVDGFDEHLEILVLNKELDGLDLIFVGWSIDLSKINSRIALFCKNVLDLEKILDSILLKGKIEFHKFEMFE